MQASRVSELSESTERWRVLGLAMQSRYQSSAEAFMAFGGRAGFPLKSSDFHKALRDLAVKARQAKPAVVIDVNGLMADIESSYRGGLTFAQFQERIRLDGSGDAENQGNLNGSVGGQRIMVGNPASALRGPPGSRPGTPKTMQASPSPSTLRSSQKAVVSADTSRLQQVRNLAGGDGGRGSIGGEIEGHADGGMSGPGAGRWKGKREPPPSWMMKQRQLSAMQGGDARPPVKFATPEAARTVGIVRMAGKQQLLDSAQQRLYSILQKQPPEPPNHTPVPREAVAPVEHKELVSPVNIRQGYDNERPPPRPPRDQQPLAAQQGGMEESLDPGTRGSGVVGAAQGFASRLRALDGVVMEQRLSLAETEKNVLRRERAELQAQLRRQAIEQRQSQEQSQQKLQEQLQTLCMTFEKVGHAMLQNGGGGGGRGAQGGEAGPPAPNDRRLLDELERKLEERIEAELLPYCTDGANSTKLASRPQQFACVVGAGGPSSGSSDRQLGIKLAEKLGQPGKEAIGDDKAGERVWSYGRLKTPMDLHRPDSPALAALLTGGIFSPVCSWVQDDATGIGGSVGELSKMDPLRENDWVDDFLLEVIMAIGIRDALQYPISFMPVWLSLSTLDEDKIKTFPTKHLPSLSLKPSISTNAMALKLLTSAGVPVTPKLARMSIREAMATLASEPGVWLGGQGDSVKTVLANDGLEHACNCIASLAKARALLPAARDAQEKGRLVQETGKALDLEGLPDKQEDSSFAQDDDDDEFASQQKKDQARMEMARREKNQQELLERKRREDEIVIEAAERGKAVLLAWTEALRGLPKPLSEAQEIVHAELPRQGILLSDEPTVLDVFAKASNSKLKPWEELRKRKDRHLMIDTVAAWCDTAAKHRSAANLESRNNLKKLFKLFVGACKDSRARREGCFASYALRNSQMQRIPMLAWAWERWNEVEDLGALGDDEPDQQQPADLEETLHMLQQAVVETHSKHSRLLEMTHKEEQLQGLMDRLPPAVSKALTQAGITSVPELININKVKGDDGLRNLGIDDAPHREMLSVLLQDADGDASNSRPDPDSIAGARDKMASEMEALRIKLQVKQQKLAQSVEDMKREGLEEEPVMTEQEKSLAVVNKVLESLGGQALQPQHVMQVKNKWDGGEDMAAGEEGEGAKDPEGGLAKSDAPHPRAVDGEEDETDGDKETRRYMDHLKAEGDVHQAVLKLLSEKLEEETKKQEDKEDEGPRDERNQLVLKQKEMEESLKQAIKVIDKARSLLDQPEGNAGHDQLPDDKRGHSRENDSCTCSFKADGSLKVANELCPVNRVAAEGLAEKHTSSEEEAIRLAEEAKRRLEHSDALELENSRLKRQIVSAMEPRLHPGDRGEADGAEGDREEEHWTSMLSDPELAAKYAGGGGGGGWDDSAVQAPPSAAEPRIANNLSWKLTSVEGGLPVSRSDVLDSEIERRVASARQGITSQIEACEKKIKALEVDRDQRLKDLEEGKMPKVSEEKHDEAVLAIAGAREQIRLLEEQLSGLDWQRELKELEADGQRLEDEARVTLEDAKQAHAADPTLATEANVKECEDKLVRVKASTQIKIRQREKEVEMVVLALKMQEDEQRLKDEQKRLQEQMAAAQIEEQEQLAKKLRSMSDTVDTTIRGRCRPEVLANLAGVNKLKSAISKHRLAVDSAKEQEKKKLEEQIRQEDDKKKAEETKKENEILAKAERKTQEMVHRERLLKEAEEALANRKSQLFKEAGEALDKAEKAVQSGTGETGELHKMWVDESGEVENGTRYHAQGVLAAAQAIAKDLSGAVGPEDEERHQKLQERMKALQDAVGGAEKRLKDEAEQSLKDIEAIMKKDTKNMSPDLAREIAKVRISCETSLSKLKDVGAKGRDLAAVETKLKSTWERGNSAIKTSLRAQLTRGDAELDAALAALNKGSLPAATAQLAKAKAAYENAKLAQAIAVGEDAS